MNYIARKRKMLTLIIFLMASTLLYPITAPLALAQSSKGILTGTVTDPTGAVVAGANVKITNTATGTVRETETTGEGNYRIDAVDPGVYNVVVTTSGFKTVTLNNVQVAAGQASTSDFKLEVGTQGESINVTADSTNNV